MSEDTWLVIGLGNPGPKYAGNRHNVGAMVVDTLAARAGARLRTHKAGASAESVGLGPAPGDRAVIAVPHAYMNLSGGPVKGLATFFSVPPDRTVVIHDELDIPFGQVRLKCGGGEGGHNGLRSITASFGTKDYLRVRVGIDRPPGRLDAASYVLKDFSSIERKELALLLDDAADAVELVVEKGLIDAQQVVHAPRP